MLICSVGVPAAGPHGATRRYPQINWIIPCGPPQTQFVPRAHPQNSAELQTVPQGCTRKSTELRSSAEARRTGKNTNEPGHFHSYTFSIKFMRNQCFTNNSIPLQKQHKWSIRLLSMINSFIYERFFFIIFKIPCSAESYRRLQRLIQLGQIWMNLVIFSMLFPRSIQDACKWYKSIDYI